MALKDAPASATTGQKPKDMSPQGLMKMILEKSGTQVEVCAIYLPNAGLEADALLAQRILVTGHFIRITHVYPG